MKYELKDKREKIKKRRKGIKECHKKGDIEKEKKGKK